MNAMVSIGQLVMKTNTAAAESIIKAYSRDDCPDLWKAPSLLIVKLLHWLVLLLPRVKIYCPKQKVPFDEKLLLLSRGYTMRLGAYFL